MADRIFKDDRPLPTDATTRQQKVKAIAARHRIHYPYFKCARITRPQKSRQNLAAQVSFKNPRD